MHLLGYRETVTYPIPSSQKPPSTRTKSSLDKPKIFPRNNFHQKLSPTPRIITSHSRFLLSLFLLPSLSLFLEGGKLKWGWMGTSPRYTGIYIMKFTVVGRRRGGRLPREPQPGRIENMRKKYSQDSGEPGRGGVCEFYILPGYRGRRKEEGGWGGGALHLAGRRIRVSASRLRWNKDANYCLARAPGNDPTPPTGTERRKPEGSLLFRVWNEVRRMYQACLRDHKMFEMENKILNTSHHFLKFICFELHVCILYLFLFFFVLRQV